MNLAGIVGMVPLSGAGWMLEGPCWVGAAARVARAACRDDIVSVVAAGGW